MNLRTLVSVCLCTLIFTSCVDDEARPILEFSDVEMVLKGTYDGNPFIKNRTYAYNDGSRLRFSAFNFFVSDLSTSVNLDENFALDEIEYIDLALFEGEEAALAGYLINIGRAPIGDYRGFSFGIGVSPELNKTTPDEYSLNHPLGDADLYSEESNSYKFVIIAGEVDYNSDGIYDADFNFTTGFDQNFRTFTSTQGLSIESEVVTTIEIEIDLKKVLDNGIRAIDFNTQLNTSANPLDEIMLLLNSNIESAITVR